MSEKYCPVGKIECDEYGKCMVSDFEEFEIEVCPWTSRQVRVEPVPTSTESPYLIPMSEPVEQTFDRGFAAGRREQARVDRDAVEKLLDDNLHAVSECALEKALAALAAVAPREEA